MVLSRVLPGQSLRQKTINDTMCSTTMLIIKTTFPRGLLMIDCSFGRSSDLLPTVFGLPTAPAGAAVTVG